MKKLDEDHIIQILQKKLGNSKFVAEDVEVYKQSTGSIIVAVDTLVESTDIPPGMKISDISRKSIAACVSDFAAKGVRPEFGIISLVLPEKYSKKQIIELAGGFQRASKEFGIRILGGDTNEGGELSISTILYGNTDKIVTRNGAKSGELVCVTGPFGNTAAGLQSLLRNKKCGSKQFDSKIVKAFCTPKPKLNFGIMIKKYISSSMDSSDGLAKTLNEMANQSNKKFIINKLPYEKTLELFARKNKICIEDLVLFGGEEYEFVFTIPAQNISKVMSIAKKENVKIIKIGKVQSGMSVYLQSGNNTLKIPNRGWKHFQK